MTENKLLLELEPSKTLILLVAEKVATVFGKDLLVATAPGSDAIHQAVDSLSIRCIEIPESVGGMGSTIAGAVRYAPRGAPIAIVLGDMPFVSAPTLAALRDRLAHCDERVIVPASDGSTFGNPVGFGVAYRSALEALEGPRGAKHLIEENLQRVVAVQVSDAHELLDIDSERDWALAKGIVRRKNSAC